MKLEIMDGEKTSASEQPSVTVIQAEESRTPSAGGKKSRVSRKHVIIGVTCALVVAMVITGVLVGVKFYLDGANKLVTHIFEFKTKENAKVKEDVGADVKENYVQYHRQDDDSEVTVIEDFNRELQVMKVREVGGSKCYITVLNTSDSALPEAVLNASATDEIVETVDKYFEVSETAIKDHSMLGAHGRKLCTNLDVYWMTETCGSAKNETLSISDDDSDSDSVSHREKRGFWGKVKSIGKKVKDKVKSIGKKVKDKVVKPVIKKVKSVIKRVICYYYKIFSTYRYSCGTTSCTRTVCGRVCGWVRIRSLRRVKGYC